MFHRFEYKMNRVICSHPLTHVHRQQHRRGSVSIYKTHDCVWRCNFLEMNNSGEQSGATVASRELYRKFMEERLSHGVNPHN